MRAERERRPKIERTLGTSRSAQSLAGNRHWLSFFLLALCRCAFPGQSRAAPRRTSLEPIGAAADQNRDEERGNLPPRDLDQEPHEPSRWKLPEDRNEEVRPHKHYDKHIRLHNRFPHARVISHVRQGKE